MLGARLKKLRTSKKLTQKQLAEKINVTNVSISGYESGNRFPDTDTLKKIADYFEVSTDYLLGRSDSPQTGTALPELTSKDEQDIARKLESILGDLDSESSLAFDGEPLDDVTRELVREQIESNLRLAKQLAKQKFTPKKYKK